MFDLQAIYVRDVAELTGVDLTAMIRITDEPIAGISDIQLNGISSDFFALDSTSLMVSIPASFMRRISDGVQDISSGAYGYVAQGINNIKVIRTYTVGEGVEEETYSRANTIVWNDDVGLASRAPAGTRKVTLDTSVLRLTGQGYDKAVNVRVNNIDVPFTVRASTSILTVLPGDDLDVTSVDVITTSSRLGRTTFFEYLIGGTINPVSGTYKLVQQFVKLLMTTPGTDLFSTGRGGNMQNWVGQRVNPRMPQMLVAKTVMNVVMTGTQMQIAQMDSPLPADERLSDVQVLDAQMDPNDPTAMNLAIKLNTFGGRSAFFSILVGSVEQQMMDAVGDAPTFF